MATPKPKQKSYLLIGFMYSDNCIFKEVSSNYTKYIASLEISFDFTDFYTNEFGIDLKKKYIALPNFNLENLPELKLKCYELETKYSKNNKRLINIDPGYITKNSVILASFKHRAHRIYLNNGVYADLQLVFENKQWKSFKWTFPDLMHKDIQDFLTKIYNLL